MVGRPRPQCPKNCTHCHRDQADNSNLEGGGVMAFSAGGDRGRKAVELPAQRSRFMVQALAAHLRRMYSRTPIRYPVQITKHIITKHMRLPTCKYAPTQ